MFYFWLISFQSYWRWSGLFFCSGTLKGESTVHEAAAVFSHCTAAHWSLSADRRAADVVFCSLFAQRQRDSPPTSAASEADRFKARRVPCALVPPAGHPGEHSIRIWAAFCLERFMSPHPASKYHDCILGDSLPSAWKAKNKSLLTPVFLTSLCFFLRFVSLSIAWQLIPL